MSLRSLLQRVDPANWISWLEPRRTSAIKKSAEAAVLPLMILVLLHLLPGVRFDYPWWWLAPLAIALRYGVTYGLGSGLVLVVGNFFIGGYFGSAAAMPGGEIVGGLIATYLAGLYASHAQNRLIEANARLDYLEQRLESLTRVFYVTRLSHSRLEESLITRSKDLRSALDTIARELARPYPYGEPLPTEPLQHMLQLLAYYGRLGNTGVFEVVQDRVQRDAIARLGRPFTLDVSDPLIRGVIENQQLAYYSVDQILEGQASSYRVAMPMSAADGTLLAIIVVVELPLLAVEEENLLTLAAMTAYVADALRSGQVTREILECVPWCPADIALEWTRLGHLHRRAQVRSSWVRLAPAEAAREQVIDVIFGARRGLDPYWRNPVNRSESGLMVLLPLSGRGATEGFLARINALCSEKLGGDLSALGWRVLSGRIGDGKGEELKALLEREA